MCDDIKWIVHEDNVVSKDNITHVYYPTRFRKEDIQIQKTYKESALLFIERLQKKINKEYKTSADYSAKSQLNTNVEYLRKFNIIEYMELSSIFKKNGYRYNKKKDLFKQK